MKEYLLLIRTFENHFDNISKNEQDNHLRKVGDYIGRLMKQGKLKSAQPLEFEGVMITSRDGKIKDGPYNESKEVVAGYFLIEAGSLEEAISIAKDNPVFDYEFARIEVRPIKKIEGIN